LAEKQESPTPLLVSTNLSNLAKEFAWQKNSDSLREFVMWMQFRDMGSTLQQTEPGQHQWLAELQAMRVMPRSSDS
jgi:hypothetical protein